MRIDRYTKFVLGPSFVGTRRRRRRYTRFGRLQHTLKKPSARFISSPVRKRGILRRRLARCRLVSVTIGGHLDASPTIALQRPPRSPAQQNPTGSGRQEIPGTLSSCQNRPSPWCRARNRANRGLGFAQIIPGPAQSSWASGRSGWASQSQPSPQWHAINPGPSL